MKVLWVTNTPCSSIERNGDRAISGGWLSSLEKAVRDDIELEIAFLSSEQRQEEFLYEGVKYHSIAPYSSGNYFIFRLKRLFMPWSRQDALILERLEHIIKDVRPDIIHIHGTEKCFGLIYGRMNGADGCIETGGARIPVAISIQGIMALCQMKYFAGISRHDVRKYESLGCRLKKQSAIRMYGQIRHQAHNEAEMLMDIRYIIGRTAWDKDYTGKMNPDRIYFTVGEIMRTPFYGADDNIPGTDRRNSSGQGKISVEIRDRAQLKKASEGNDGRADVCRDMENVPYADRETGDRVYTCRKAWDRPIRIATTISDGIYKGYELLLEVAARLRAKGVGYIWTVIGYGADNEAVSVSEKSTGLNSSELGIRLAGRLDAEEIVRELSGADIYCQVSHIENSPNSLCEAMLLGLPSVATEVGGTSSLIDSGRTGILVSDTAPDGFADAIISLASDRAAAACMGHAARQAALARHDPAKVKRQLLDTYKEIILSIR